MSKVSLGRAWLDTQVTMAAEWRLLLPIALALVALPSVVLQYLTGREGASQMWTLLAIPLLLLTVIASLAITKLVLTGGLSVAEALSAAVRRAGVAIVASFLIGLAGVLAALPIFPYLPRPGVPAGSMPPFIALYGILFLIALLTVGVRMLLVNPAVIAEPVGVISALKRSWALTRGQFARLVVLLMAMLLATLLVGAAARLAGGSVLLLLGRVMGDPELGPLLVLILGALVNAVITTYFLVIIAHVYRQLAGPSNGI